MRTKLAHSKPLRLALAGVALAGVVLAWIYLTGQQGSDAAITASGTIEAEEVSVVSEVAARIERLNLDEGDPVKAGDELVVLDTSLLDAQVRQAQAAVEVARASLALVERGPRAEDLRQAEAALAQVTAQRDTARTAWEYAKATRDDPQDINARINVARPQLAAAEARLAQIRGGAREADLEAARASVEVAQQKLAEAEAGAKAQEIVAAEALVVAQARLDVLRNGPTRDQIAEAEAGVRSARNQLYATQAAADAQLASGRTPFTKEMKEAQSGAAFEQVAAAEARLSQLTAPPRPESLKQAEAAVEQARADLGAKRAVSEPLVQAARAGVDSAMARLRQTQEGATQEELAIAEAAVEQARRNLDDLLALRSNPIALNAQIDTAQGQHEAAEAAVRVAQARLEGIRNGATPQEMAIARAQLRQAEAAIGVLEAQLQKTKLKAPITGLVARRMVRAGETASPGMRLLTLANLDTVKLTIYVSEGRIGRVQLRQQVEVSVDSFPGQTFAGEVVYISPRAEFTPRNVQSQKERASTVFAVRVSIPNPNHALKAGMPADARIKM
ncbi:MAG: efflux RND transporter periplasmic adaptor subunit [Chloroflexi bacterium]|nr:efflux RND transporter periplasmic adaptor subunit [Chloroflexota bacterium]